MRLKLSLCVGLLIFSAGCGGDESSLPDEINDQEVGEMLDVDGELETTESNLDAAAAGFCGTGVKVLAIHYDQISHAGDTALAVCYAKKKVWGRVKFSGSHLGGLRHILSLRPGSNFWDPYVTTNAFFTRPVTNTSKVDKPKQGSHTFRACLTTGGSNIGCTRAVKLP